MPEIEVEDVLIGHAHAPAVVAEIGINHGGSLEVAKSMVFSAVQAGVRLIKHQTHIPLKEMSAEADHAIPGNASTSIFQVISENSLSMEDEFSLAAFARGLGAIYFSTPFSREAADFLSNEINVPLFKIGSGECNNYPLVEHIAKKRLPVILSTGMNSIDSISISVKILEEYRVPYALLHTTNLYPTPQKLIRLGAIEELSSAFPKAVIGLSDHSSSNSSSYAAIALGAALVERHFTDDKSRVGPDIPCSMDGNDASDLIRIGNEIFESLGGRKEPADEERVTMNFAFSSVSSIVDIAPGQALSNANIFPIRPSGGAFGPLDYPHLIGKISSRHIPARRQLTRDDFI